MIGSTKRNNSQGSAPLIALLVIMVLLAIGFVSTRNLNYDLRSLAKGLPSPSATPSPSSSPMACSVTLGSVTYPPDTFCSSGQFRKANYICSNGTSGSVMDVSCQPTSRLQLFATQACAYKSTCNTQQVSMTETLLVADPSCIQTNTAKQAIIQCSDGTWGRVDRFSCSAYSEFEQVGYDICSSRARPW